MVTMADVAGEADVSISTVSHVVNRTRPVSAARTARVERAIAATGYSPNAVARSLATSRTKLIGIVMSATSNPFFAPVFSAMEETARRNGYTALLADSHDDVKLEASQVRLMLDQRVAGMILAPATADPMSVLNLLFDRKVPTVLVDRFSDDRFDQVGTENLEATAQLVTHLAALGHDRIGFVGGRGGLSTTVERLAGYRLGIERSGLLFDRHLVRSGDSRSRRARVAALKLLALPEPPTAIVSMNNDMTLGVLRALRESGLRAPDDIAIAGFDDIECGDLIDPGLTVIAQPVIEIGRSAVKLLLRRIKEPETPAQSHRIVPSFVHRESCGCARSGWRPLSEVAATS